MLCSNRTKTMLAAGLLALLGLGMPAAAEDDLTVPTGWWWLSNATTASIQDKVDEGYRVTDLQVASLSPLRFAAVFVYDAGAYAQNSSWYVNLTPQILSIVLAQSNGRLTDLETYYIAGQKYHAAVIVSNTGANAKAWWYYTDVTFNQMMAHADDNNARIVDVDRYLVNGVYRFSAVMIHNTGADYKPWWIYSNVSPAYVSDRVSEHSARIVDIEDRGNGNLTVVLVPREGKAWWWYHGITSSYVNDRCDQNGARLIDIEPYVVNGQTRYLVSMINNSNQLTSEVRALMSQGQEGGAYGFRAERVGGATLASLRPDYEFYPASSIKVMAHLHAMRMVENIPELTIDSPVSVYREGADSCDDDHGGQTVSVEPLQDVLRSMLENSNNDSTNAILDMFGMEWINLTAHSFAGMSESSILQSKFGSPCGGPGADPANQLTVRDLNRLYELVAQGQLFDQDSTRDTFYDLMSNGLWVGDLIDEEAPADLAEEDLDAFKALVRTAHKGGSWTTGSGVKYGVSAGWIHLPGPSCNDEPRELVVSVFIEGATVLTGGTGAPLYELIRDDVRASLEAWRDCANCPADLNGDGAVDALDALNLIAEWGSPSPHTADIAPEGGDGVVDAQDWLALIAAWGSCS